MKEFGLLGDKLSHSFSPVIHDRILKEEKIMGNYHLIECQKEDLGKKLEELKSLGFSGLNVTMPHKVEIMTFLDQVSEEAKKINAVNTISFKDGKALGYNTDYHGFGMLLDRNNVSIKNERAVVLGSGGASKAVVQYLIDQGIAEITIVSRDPSIGKEKYPGLQVINYQGIQNLKGYGIIINTTPCGMFPNISQSPVNRDHLSNFHTVIDVIYNPQETLFLSYAKEKGLKAINGLYMLVGQAIKSQEIWNGLDLSQDKCERIYEKILKSN